MHRHVFYGIISIFSLFIFLNLSIFDNGVVSYRNKIMWSRLAQNKRRSVCNSIFSIGEVSGDMDENLAEIIDHIRRSKEDDSKILRRDAYLALADRVPSMYDKKSGAYYKDWPLKKDKGKFPHLPCKIKEYTTEMLRQCVLVRKKKRKRTHIFFMGDSRTRQLVEVFIDAFRDMDFRIHTHEGDVLSVENFFDSYVMTKWTKYKKKFTAYPQHLNLTLEFHWTSRFEAKSTTISLQEPIGNPNLNNSTKEELLNEIKNSTNRKHIYKDRALHILEEMGHRDEESLPDIVILGTAAWGLKNGDNFLRVFDEIILHQTKTIAKAISQLKKKTNVVWLLPNPVKDYLIINNDLKAYKSNLKNSKLELVVNSQKELNSPGVTIWDSFLPIAEASMRDCRDAPYNETQPQHPALKYSRSWRCQDNLHTNEGAIYIGVQMIVNSICNEFMPRTGTHCCQ